MIENVLDVKEIILHKNEPLALKLVAIQPETQEGFEKAKEVLLAVEQIAIGISPYNKSRLNDINIGHWDLYRYGDVSASSIRIPLFEKLPARNPNADVKPNSVIAIDFGTKSTTVGIIDESGEKRLLRVGSRTSGEIKKEDYENPTIMEFRNIPAFQIAYSSCKTRPLTALKDLCISHIAANHQNEALAEDFSRFFSKLKQWAGYGKTYRVKDQDNNTISLKEFLHIGSDERDLNPIEIYAYYLARFINTMDNGIYTTYLLSYPDKFSKEVREQIRASFERGIKKAIPYAVLTNPNNSIKVEQIATEPAAYAICALDEYGFMREKFLKRSLEVYYGVFDFGGGTTDFDFGVLSLSQTKGYTYRLEHFGGGGDEKLGGENLLEFLAYEAFKQNLERMRESGCKFSESPFPDPELNDAIRDQVDNSEEARRNSAAMIKVLRLIVENIQAYEEFGDLSNTSFDLCTSDGDNVSVSLQIESKKLIDQLTQKIQAGVEKFFQEFLATARSHFPSQSKDDGLLLHIFLGGNAARSPIVKEAFEALIKRESKGGISFELHAPLGTPEADDEIVRQFGASAIEQDLAKKVTCKTGVVFGLLESRPSNRRIEIISSVGVNDDAKFKYFLGTGDAKEFSLVIDRNALHDGSKQLFLDHAHFTEYELLYTPDQRAADEREDYSSKELNAKLKTIRLDKAYGEDDSIYIQAKGANGIQVSVISQADDSVLYSVDYILE